MGFPSGGPPAVFAGGVSQAALMTVRVTSGYPDATHIEFRGQKGTLCLYGLGFSDQRRDIYTATAMHADCVNGSPSSFSDERIKDNQVAIEPSNCLSFCNSLTPCLYLQTLSNEVRSGLIAQEVAAACQTHSLPEEPILDKKWATVDGANEELLALRYERLVPMLLGAVKELTARVQELESKP